MMVSGLVRPLAPAFVAVAVGGALVMTTPAMAQTENSAAATETEAAADDGGNPWRKLCLEDPASKKEVCITRQEARNEEGQAVAAVSVRMTEGEKPRLLVEVPNGVLLPPGLGYQIDENEVKQAIYVICTGVFCSAEAEVDEEFISRLKAGSNLVVQMVNHTEQVVGIGFTLIGFTATFEGEGQNLAEYQAARQAVQEGLQERAEQARQRLQNQGGTATE